MSIPRDPSLAEALYMDIDQNDYLNEIYDALLYNYSIKLFGLHRQPKDVNIVHAVRFADLLAKSTYPPTCDRDHQWGQAIAILLRLIYPEDETVKYYLGSVLSAVGNYRGLKSPAAQGFKSADLLERIYYEYDMDEHRIPGAEDDFFFHDQKRVYDGLGCKFFSYSGPTSMGKSFVVQTYIKEQVENGSIDNFAILVPTKALINEVRSSLLESLQTRLKELNYRVVTSKGDLVLKQDHHFIFVMTPERLLHMMIEQENITVDFLFIDEAHKISERGSRATYYYKVLSHLWKLRQMPTVIFASPNIPNPEVYFNLIPGVDKTQTRKLVSRFTPVCQFKYFLNLAEGRGYYYNDYTKEVNECLKISERATLDSLVTRIGKGRQNLVYCNSRQKVVDYAYAYSQGLSPLHNRKLEILAGEIRTKVHSQCYLAEMIEKGVAYHVGYLPANIRLRIERAFEDGDLRTIFCTSTLVEGVNLPADNLFITSYKDGPGNMDEVEFKNLVGRVGRIRHNLYGNVILIRLRDERRIRDQQFIDLLQSEIPPQKTAIEAVENSSHFEALVKDMANGDVEFTGCHTEAGKDFDTLRKFGLILMRDIATDMQTPIRSAFEQYIDADTEKLIKEKFPEEKTSDDITLSYDQAQSLEEAIAKGLTYPSLQGVNDDVDFEALVKFLMTLRHLFKWETYEYETIGRPGNQNVDDVLRAYAVVLLRWIRGNGLSTIIHFAIDYRKRHPEKGVWVNGRKIADTYNDSVPHKNYIIAETLGVIENVLLFSISNYFRKFSIAYKEYHNVDHFENDWYEFVEYGTTNPLTIFLQQVGFDREASLFLEQPTNRKKYIDEDNEEIKIRRSIFSCGDENVETQVNDIQFNMPELFVD